MLGLTAGAGVSWLAQCWRVVDGLWTLRWEQSIPENLVVTEGLNTLLTRSFKTIPGDVNWYVGLKGSGTAQAADTMASHGSWAEITPYSNATRPAYTPGAVASGQVDNAAAPASFTINATTSVYGVFLSSDNTKSGAAGLLYSAGDFAVPEPVSSPDVLSVTATLKQTAL